MISRSMETHMLLRWSLFGVSLAVLGFGCAPEPAQQQKPAAPAKIETPSPAKDEAPPAADETAAPAKDESIDEAKTAESPEPADAEIDVTMIDAEGLQHVVDQHAGKVVLVDCWATFCIPCMKEFPKTVELSRKHADDGLVVLSLSFDDPKGGAAPKKVKDFLQKQDADFAHYISSLDLSDEDIQQTFGIEGGALPHYKLYDRTGKLIASIFNPDDSEDVPADAPTLHEKVAAAVEGALKAE
jgi:thiol-disulfide isomerase/thioredoxin